MTLHTETKLESDDMATKHAATLNDQQFAKLLREITEKSRRPLVDKVAFLLSYKAGLRAQEIAGLRWKKNVLDSKGEFRMEEFQVPGSKGRVKREEYPVLFIGSDIGKYGNERTLRMHPMLVTALTELRDAEGIQSKWVIPSGKNGASQDLKSRAHALAMRINRIYMSMGLDQCTSHSGRRTFITKAARAANTVGCSLRDVQSMAGHKDMSTTQQYIDLTHAQADLVGIL